ncbi:MAG: hypothetical protein FWC11_06755 [Firmicutes bacterium]|nr:hypothetical protein [Bacillota bacterium]MCL2256525.1 hypothetical protein [Bacillota bacterium]
MVSRIREVRTEEDRYGGYGRGISENIRSFERAKDFLITEEVVEKTDSVPFEFSNYDRSTLVYSKRNATMPKEQVHERKYPTYKSVSAPYSAKKESQDLMPSIKTQAYAKSVKREQEVYQEKDTDKTRFRVTAAIYIIAVMVITALVIGIAVAISSASGGAIDPYYGEIVASISQGASRMHSAEFIIQNAGRLINY